MFKLLSKSLTMRKTEAFSFPRNECEVWELHQGGVWFVISFFCIFECFVVKNKTKTPENLKKSKNQSFLYSRKMKLKRIIKQNTHSTAFDDQKSDLKALNLMYFKSIIENEKIKTIYHFQRILHKEITHLSNTNSKSTLSYSQFHF